MQSDSVALTNLKAFAAKVGVTSAQLVLMLEDFPKLYFWKRRKKHPKYRTLIPADVKQLQDLITG